MKDPVTAYMFGYSGWGNATAKLIEAVTAVEKAKRCKPPLFVDVRMRRDVRADGFHEDRFEELLGRGNYEWMPLLGNLAVRKDLKKHLENLENAIFICYPPAARTLLDRADECRKQNRHLIFFCSCETPDGCHRFEVARLLKREAHKGHRTIEVVEWPGGDPVVLEEPVPVTNKSMPTATSPNLYLRRVDPFPLATYAALPTGSRVSVTINGETRQFPVGPARYSKPKRRWYLETLRNEGYVPVAASEAAVEKYRAYYGYKPVTTRS